MQSLVCYQDIFPLAQILSIFYLFRTVFHEIIPFVYSDVDLAASPDSPFAHAGDGGAAEKKAAGEGPAGNNTIT